MAKTYLDVVKYLIESKFSIDGLVDKPDIIGAVFGQTEGLLGDELDLRELQKNGKIGRIEIEISQSQNKTYGKLFLPASLDRVETCILAAAVEAVDRVGPYEAQFSIEKVEDTRSEKRRKILDRAKDLVKNLLNTEIPDSRELAELVQSEVKQGEIIAYGAEKLPAGPDVGKTGEIIIVEGRADVLNLIRNDINNAIAVGGASSVPQSIIKLANEREVTVFLDGDRGGDLILRTLMNAVDVDYIAKAPDGKEVEELARKEVIKSLRTRVPIDQYLGTSRMDSMKRDEAHNKPRPMQSQQQRTSSIRSPMPPSAPSPNPQAQASRASEQTSAGISEVGLYDDAIDRVQRIESEKISVIKESVQQEKVPAMEKPALESILLTQLSNSLNELSGTLNAMLFDQAGNVISKKPIREILSVIQDTDNCYAVVLDGVITQRLVELAQQKGIKAIYGIRANPLPRRHPSMLLYTKEQGKIE